MKCTRTLKLLSVLILVGGFQPAIALSYVNDVDSVFLETYRFNDFPGTNLTVTDSFPTQLRLEENNYVDDGPPNWANRHLGFFSSDSGLNPRAFLNSEGFDISFDLTLTSGSATVAKEAGFMMDTLIGGEGQFLAKSDGEIAAFGSFFPFYSFTASQGVSYTPGETINMRMIYLPAVADAGDPNTILTPASLEYLVDLPSDAQGAYSSGVLELFNAEQGVIDNSEFGVYVQSPPENVSDSVDANFENFIFAQPNTENADFDFTKTVDGVDFLIWQQGTGSSGGLIQGDANRSGFVDGADLAVWESQYGSSSISTTSAAIAVPEPGSITLAFLCSILFSCGQRTVVRCHRSTRGA